jgi:hypothetical protein
VALEDAICVELTSVYSKRGGGDERERGGMGGWEEMGEKERRPDGMWCDVKSV